MALVLRDDRDGVARLTLNRPEKLNALMPATFAELRSLGRSRAKELMFTARRIDGTEAARIGLADRCVPDEDLGKTVAALAAEITASSWGTNRIDKALMRTEAAMSRRDALAYERTLPYGRPDDAEERMSRGPGT